MMMRKESEIEEVARCATACNYGQRRFVAEKWFARALRLERKRSERSRKPFVLVLVNIESFASLNGNKQNSVNQVVNALASFMRETDVTGWYRDGSVLGNIFTELGTSCTPSESVASIRAKINLALQTHVGPEMSGKIKVSCHVFPEDWTKQKPNGRIDSTLYPELDDEERPGWLHSAGKRMVDILLSSLALVIFLPVFLLVSVAVKLTSKGPVLFRQERVGQRGKRFTFLKFRSMHTRNQSTIHEQYVRKLISGNLGVPQNGVFKIQNDPRVTPVGRVLRKTSLDELPQLWNVLKGEMSLVGPRPPLPYEVEVYDLWHRRRVLEAKPGITGLWQVTGRSRTCFDDMVRLDLHYTQSSSLWLDLKILLQTPRAVLAGDGAY
jgi:lipopolysaccharide/colanic/teichoic acid biosynthesis glycosyltransferase